MCRALWLCSLSLASLLAQFPVSTAHAQPVPSKAPSSTHIFPAGGRRGTKLNVLVGAECIPPETRFQMFGKGVTLRSLGFEKSLGSTLLTERVTATGEPSPRRRPVTVPITFPREWKSSLEIDKNAPLGVVHWRLSCAQGGTELRPFVVGDWPEFIERESNSTPATANRITLPVTVNGRISGERDNDYFRFHANRGDVVVCEVLAARLKSRLDPIVEILDSDARPVRSETAYVGRDPVLAFRAETNGDYLLRIANVSHHGDPAHVYRVNISTRPFVRSYFPTGGRAGSEREIEFRLMTGTDKSLVVKRRVKFPADAKRQADGMFPYRLRTDDLQASHLVEFNVVSERAESEAQGNETADTAQPLTLPVRIDGRSSSRDDQDWFRFSAKKGVNYTILCDTPAAGSSAMPTLLLTNATGKQLQFQRSVESENGACRIEWECPADGEYRLRVRDQQFGAKGGPEFVYRLTVRQSRPDFELFVPSEFANVPQDQTIHIPIFVKRYGGFDDPIRLYFEGLPEGVKAEAELINGKRSRFEIAISAKNSAPSRDAVFRIIGRGRAGAMKLERAAMPKSMLVSRLQAARSAFNGRSTHNGPTEVGTPTGIHLTVQHRPVFRLYCFEAYQYAHRGSVFRYPMTVQRLHGFKGDVTLQVGDRQNRDMDGIEIGTVNVPTSKSEAIVPIYLPETMHINEQSQSQLYTQGYAHFTDEHGRRQAMLVLSEKRNMLRTLPPVVKLKAVTESVMARAGEVLKIPLQLERTTNFPGEMSVTLQPDATRAGFIAEPLRFRPGQTRAVAALRVPKTLAGGAITVTFRAAGLMKDGTRIISEAAVTVRSPR